MVIPLQRNHRKKINIAGDFIHVQKEGKQVRSEIIVSANACMETLTEAQKYHLHNLGLDINFMTIQNQQPRFVSGRAVTQETKKS